RMMKLWDVESGKEVHTFWLDAPPGPVFFFEGGKKILAVRQIWDVARRTYERKFSADGCSLEVFPDGRKFLFLDRSTETLKIWHAFTAKLLGSFPAAVASGKGTKISPDGNWALIPNWSHL